MSVTEDETKSAFTSLDDRRRSGMRLIDSPKDTSFIALETNVNQVSEVDPESSHTTELRRKARPFMLFTLAAVILGWWISATVLKATRHRWQVISFTYFPPTEGSQAVNRVVQTVFAWSFIT